MDRFLHAVAHRTRTAAAQSSNTSAVGNVWLERWHLLSLDAPSVAAAWTWLVARAAHVELPWTEFAAMFLAVWILYAADRLLDARGLSTGDDSGLERRHIFHHDHRVRFRSGMILACVLLAALLPRMPGVELQRYVLLGTLLVGWFLVIHTGSKPLPKEFVVGIFFAAAVFIPTVVRAPGLRAEMLLPAILLGALCSLNCVFIYAWESTGQHRNAHGGTLIAARFIVPAALLVALACALAMEFIPPDRLLLGACGAAVLLLLALHSAREQIAPTTLRALADLALLTPLLAGLWLR